MRKLVTTMALIGAAASAGCANLGWPRDRADLVVPTATCTDTDFIIYFNEGSDRLTQPAMQLIRETTRNLKTCRITRARVVGLADATGAPQANLTLSQRRALRAAEALRAEGVPAPSFEIDAGGAAGALTADGRDDPVRRRAVVFLSVAP
ncbi:MAG TPA: OmpA family protein, partial [Caulobacteraceae bacterium]|nr:OmpA family protein [Caulobacteraceae bacterium]